MNHNGAVMSRYGDLAAALISFAGKHQPDERIGGPPGAEYMRRWHLEKQADGSSLYLHQMLHSDDDRALHDHPWESESLCLSGLIYEVVQGATDYKVIAAGDRVHRTAEHAHRLIVPEGFEGKVWTLFKTGPRVRQWGFHCPSGWRHWRDYCRDGKPGEIGRGCGE